MKLQNLNVTLFFKKRFSEPKIKLELIAMFKIQTKLHEIIKDLTFFFIKKQQFVEFLCVWELVHCRTFMR